ncbi:cellulase family glycosylhydrolase [Streptomyces sp. NPDC020983]|uniref:cellulase family glycosylhydrolase n=1 Tax=Streptomyces sp. NPDC020983 TaxID=3365106 RepID=UPI0037AEF9A1
MRHRKAGLLAAGAAAAVIAACVVPSPTFAAAAASGCQVSYQNVNTWQSSPTSGGFGASLAITNLGDPVSHWKLTFTMPTGQTLTSGWNATFTGTTSVSATDVGWNGSIGTGKTDTSVGLQGTWTRSAQGSAPPNPLPQPTDFALNGVPCTGSTTTTGGTTTGGSTTGTTTGGSTTGTTGGPGDGGGSAPALHVSGNHLVTASGQTYRLLGVNRSGGEFACVQGKGMWDGPTDQASVDAMKSWNVHAVRIPLNEECWLGTSDLPAGGTSGSAYRQAVKDYVDRLVASGINVILDMHWNYGQYTGTSSACSDAVATCQKPMPDAQYAPTFWSQVAATFKGDDAVVFDLFNEPYPDAADNWADPTEAWTCLRDGGTCTGIGYKVAGMQSLVDAVRATGATNVIMSAGLTWTNDLTQWLAYKPSDPTGNLMASWHSYNFNACVTASCWDSQIGAVAAKVPVQAGEIGQNTCAHDYIDQVMAWADKNGVGYTAWTWNPWGCSGGSVLITDWNGTPTSTYGEGFKAHLLTQNP